MMLRRLSISICCGPRRCAPKSCPNCAAKWIAATCRPTTRRCSAPSWPTARYRTSSRVDVSSSRWYELDDSRDLEFAEFMFLSRERQYDRVQSLHGSYWRYGVVDHSYLYNLHFPPPDMLNDLRDEVPDIVANYPVGQLELDRLVAQWTAADPASIVVGNGAAELIKVLGQHLIEKMTISVPSFNEYENVLRLEQIDRVALDPVTFELDLDAFAESARR